MTEVGDLHFRRLTRSVGHRQRVCRGLMGAGLVAAALHLAPALTATPATTAPAATIATLSTSVAPAAVAPAAAAGASASLAAAKELPTAAEVLGLLDRTVDWFRARAAEQQMATEPSDLVALADSQTTAEQAVQAAFEFGRDVAGLLPAAADRSAPIAAGRYAQLLVLQQRLAQQTQMLQQRASALRERLAHAPPPSRASVQSQLMALQEQLQLLQARRAAIDQFVGFLTSSTNDVGGSGLQGQIATLASSVSPGRGADAPAGAASTGTGSTAGGSATLASAPPTNGIWDLSVRVLSLSGKMGRIGQYLQQTNGLMQADQALRDRLLSALRADSNAADQLLDDPADAAQQRQQLVALTTQFKGMTSALVPLAKLNILLGQYATDLDHWRDSVSRDSVQTWRTLGLRLAVLAFVLALVVGASELWRRAVNRYVRDARRRYQFMLLRRFAVWFLVAILLGSMLASRLNSFVTFAGLLTAGIAVAMQNVILSVVAYFFLIGKYGIRVGDRVQIGDVLGEVIDVGLVRLHLMEYSRAGLIPTGRVVAFSNSIVFQAAGGVFKQIPGVYFGWHEITLTLQALGQPSEVRVRLLAAVERALAEHKDEIERQNREIQRTGIDSAGRNLRSSVRLRFVSGGVEATVRYQVDQRYSAEIDEAVSQELLQALEAEPQLRPAGGPELRLNPAPGA